MSSPKLRVVFMGTPEFAVKALEAVMVRGHDVVGVFTQPDRPAGRGRRLRPPPVKTFAERHDLEVFQPAALRDAPDACARLVGLEPDAIVVAAYGLFLPTVVLEAPRYGCANIHPSLLPRHRGPSPVVTSILDGDRTTGVTIMLLDEGMDTGPVLAQQSTPIGVEETAEALTYRLFDLGSGLMVGTLDRWVAGELTPVPQDESKATFTRRLTREDGHLDWSNSAAVLERRIRGLSPWPGTFTKWGDRTLKITRGRAVSLAVDGVPGTVSTISGGRVVVATGSGGLELIEVQLEGRGRVDATEFVQGHSEFIRAELGA